MGALLGARQQPDQPVPFTPYPFGPAFEAFRANALQSAESPFLTMMSALGFNVEDERRRLQDMRSAQLAQHPFASYLGQTAGTAWAAAPMLSPAWRATIPEFSLDPDLRLEWNLRRAIPEVKRAFMYDQGRRTIRDIDKAQVEGQIPVQGAESLPFKAMDYLMSGDPMLSPTPVRQPRSRRGTKTEDTP